MLRETYQFIWERWWLQGVVWSALLVVIGLGTYWLIRRRIRSPGATPERMRTQRRLLGWAVLAMVLLGLGRVWLTEPYGSIVEAGGQNFLESIIWTVLIIAVVALGARAVQRSLLRHEVEIEVRHRVR